MRGCFSAEGNTAIDIMKQDMTKMSNDPNSTSSGRVSPSGELFFKMFLFFKMRIVTLNFSPSNFSSVLLLYQVTCPGTAVRCLIGGARNTAAC